MQAAQDVWNTEVNRTAVACDSQQHKQARGVGAHDTRKRIKKRRPFLLQKQMKSNTEYILQILILVFIKKVVKQISDLQNDNSIKSYRGCYYLGVSEGLKFNPWTKQTPTNMTNAHDTFIFTEMVNILKAIHLSFRNHPLGLNGA